MSRLSNSMLRIITLFFALSLLLLTVSAHVDTPFSRRHAPAANRMIKKRAGTLLSSPATRGNNINNVVAPPQPASSSSSAPPAASATSSDTATQTDSTQPSATQLTPAAKSSATSAPAVTTQTSSTAPSSSAALSVSNVVNSVISVLTPNNNTSSTSASSSSSSSSSSPPPTSSAPVSTPSSSQLASSTPDSQSLSSVVTFTQNETAPAPTAASTSSNAGGSVTKLQRNTIIILIAIGASIGAAGIIWTIIRKWKFSPSRTTDDRLQPIDWQPTTGVHDDHDITEKLTRNGSTRSHGSFTSGNNNHDAIVPDVPPHDFTAGPAHLAPIGGYADLQRGPSPQPGLQRGPSSRTPGDYQYETPNPHGQYYNGAPGAGAYQGGYDYNRGY